MLVYIKYIIKLFSYKHTLIRGRIELENGVIEFSCVKGKFLSNFLILYEKGLK